MNLAGPWVKILLYALMPMRYGAQMPLLLSIPQEKNKAYVTSGRHKSLPLGVNKKLVVVTSMDSVHFI